ncbi:MAG TPA: energy transducer TonB [Longimicrobium sp.]|nr:energy transducer TonB [Longimicrobium sp.]
MRSRVRHAARLLAAVAAAVLAATPAAAQKLDKKPGLPAAPKRDEKLVSPALTDPRAPDEYELSAVEAAPRLLNRDEVRRQITRLYPREMRRQRTGGTVVLRFVVLRDGTVDPLRVRVESASHVAFVGPAASVVPLMRFSPATVDGQPVNVWVAIPINFAMNPPRAPAPAPAAPPAEVASGVRAGGSIKHHQKGWP